MDLPDIKTIVQWKATCNLCTLWQCFGQAACGAGEEATAILFVEKKDTDEERTLKAEHAAQRLAKEKEAVTGQKRKAGMKLTSGTSKQSTLGERTNHDKQIIPTSSITEHLSPEMVVTERREQCRAHYKKRPTQTTMKKRRGVMLRLGVLWMILSMQQAITTSILTAAALFPCFSLRMTRDIRKSYLL
jgi:hypothetical protein